MDTMKFRKRVWQASVEIQNAVDRMVDDLPGVEVDAIDIMPITSMGRETRHSISVRATITPCAMEGDEINENLPD